MAHANAQVIDLTLDDDDKQDVTTIEPPSKRQKTRQQTGQQTTTPGPDARDRLASAALEAFNRTVQPRIDSAVNGLQDGVYDKPKLVHEVRNRLFRDGSTVAAGLATKWHFSPEREALIADKIRQILDEARYKFLLPTLPLPLRSPGLVAKPPPRVPSTSPSQLAHRPVVSVRVNGSPSVSNTPVPLPAYVKGQWQQQNGQAAPPVPAVKKSPVPLPHVVRQELARRASDVAQQKKDVVVQAPQTTSRPEVHALAPTVRPAISTQSSIPAPSTMPSTIPSTLPPTIPPTMPSTMPSTILSKMPSTRPSTMPSTILSTVPSTRPNNSRKSTTPEVKENTRHRSSSRASCSSTSVPLPLNTIRNPQTQPEVGRLSQPLPSVTIPSSPARAENSDTAIRRPYLSARERREIFACVRGKRSAVPGQLTAARTFHIDLTDDELHLIKSVLDSLGVKHLSLETVKNHPKRFDLASFLSSKLKGRNVSDIRNFLEDLPEQQDTGRRHEMFLARDDFLEQQRRRDRRINALRLNREMNGNFGVGAPMSQQSLHTEVLKDLSDSVGHVFAKFGQCSGDVATMAWISDRSILCGATSTMDDRTLDHNKQGNLVLYSAATQELEVFKDHRERRPMKEGQVRGLSRDRWLYPSVVASTFDPARKLVYTAAFDRTVKVWKTAGDSTSSMTMVGTWPHEGKVNFVAVALDGSGLVATAADVSSEAVRVYSINTEDANASQYISLSCPRKDDRGTDEWAYWPSTLQWGTAEATRHLLAVGYSPRSLDGDENKIPEDKQHTGAILLWDSRSGRVIPAHANTVANVFEVIWHPTLPQLIVATSKSGLHVEKGVRTQIRIWKQDPDRLATDQGWHEYKTLDCTAEDINEVTVMPNSSHCSYITASCTSGEIFVWDTARGDRPIHVLKHGPSIEPFENEEDMKRRDVGVKFTAWGHSPDRLFTGSSDGKVNLWNVRKKRPFIRTVMQGEGAIFCGAFSPDKKMLAIGDGPGNVWLLTDPEDHPESWGKACKKRPIPYVPDAEELDETEVDDEDKDYPRRRYLDTQELVYTGNPVVGVAQGPAYGNSTHFDLKSHFGEDRDGPLIPSVERQQQAAQRATQRRRRSLRRLKHVDEHAEQVVKRHDENSRIDFDPGQLESIELEMLRKEGVQLQARPAELSYDFAYESDDSSQ